MCLALALLAVGASLAAPSASQAAIHDCPAGPGYRLQPTSVRNMTCASAQRVLRRLIVTPAPDGRHATVRISGWRCAVVGAPNFRCARGGRAFRSFYLD